MSETTFKIKGINPSPLFDRAIYPDFYDQETGLGLSEQLYTARGAQGIGTFKSVENKGIDLDDFHQVLLVTTKPYQ